MAKKNVCNSEVAEDRYVVCFRDDAIRDPNIKVGVMIVIEYYGGRCSLVRVNWGPEEEWECPMDRAVEQHWLFSEEATTKLMALTGTHDGKGLINAIYNSFKDKAHAADFYFTEWCLEEGIDFSFFYYRQLTERMEKMIKKMRQERSGR